LIRNLSSTFELYLLHSFSVTSEPFGKVVKRKRKIRRKKEIRGVGL